TWMPSLPFRPLTGNISTQSRKGERMSRRIQRLLALFLCMVVAGTAVSVAIAGGPGKRPPMDPRGEAEGLKKGVTECFKVWHNEDGWHVRVVNGRGSRDHRYQGTITVENGVIEEM